MGDGGLRDCVGNGVDGCLGGDEAGVLNKGVNVTWSRNISNCFRDNALCKVSKGRMGGTPPNPSKAMSKLDIIQ